MVVGSAAVGSAEGVAVAESETSTTCEDGGGAAETVGMSGGVGVDAIDNAVDVSGGGRTGFDCVRERKKRNAPSDAVTMMASATKTPPRRRFLSLFAGSKFTALD